MTSPASAQTPTDTVARGNADHRELERWQRKLLPFMSRFLVVLAITFFAISLVDMYEMRKFVKSESMQAIRAKMEELLRIRENQPSLGVDVTQQALLLLEADALDKRYRQASALLMSRIWTRQLAFITGMVLTFIGAVFIIGKLTEGKSDIAVHGSEWKAIISSASPGLILAFFGSMLMAIALVVQPSIEVQDRPVYFMTMGIVKRAGAVSGPATGSETSLPDPFGDSSSSDEGKKQKIR
jgi:hypothetical protein